VFNTLLFSLVGVLVPKVELGILVIVTDTPLEVNVPIMLEIVSTNTKIMVGKPIVGSNLSLLFHDFGS
jgi:hypothetical protein